jgi:hypothetical protein
VIEVERAKNQRKVRKRTRSCNEESREVNYGDMRQREKGR